MGESIGRDVVTNRGRASRALRYACAARCETILLEAFEPDLRRGRDASLLFLEFECSRDATFFISVPESLGSDSKNASSSNDSIARGNNPCSWSS